VRDAGPSQLFYLKVRDGQMPAVASQTSCIALIQQTSGKNASDAADLLGDMNRAAAAADHSVYREVGRIGYFLIEAIVGDDIYGDGVRWFDRSPSNGQPTGHAAKGAMRHTPAAENTENRTYTSRRPQRSSSLARSRPQRMATSKMITSGLRSASGFLTKISALPLCHLFRSEWPLLNFRGGRFYLDLEPRDWSLSCPVEGIKSWSQRPKSSCPLLAIG
jgi:hypothetical protein